MDPLAHTLVGASLAETRLKRLAPLATPTLIVGANAPDIDALTMFVSGDFSLGFRRGWTHGVVAMVVLPALVAGLMMLVGRLTKRHPATAPRLVQLLPLSYLAVWTHPALDWLNTYGIRLLMPFDGRWFYGDTLFIVDPWVWLLAATPVVLAHSRKPQSAGAWIVLGIVATLLVTGIGGVPPVVRLVWCGAVAALVALRIWGGLQHRLPMLTEMMLIAIGAYAIAMSAGSALARRQAAAWLAARAVTPLEIMAGPLPANPFVRDIVVVDVDHYHFLEVNWLADETVRIASPAIARGPRGPIVEAALTAPHIHGLLTWMRFPSYQVEEMADGYRVIIRDVRYTRLNTRAIGYGAVELDRQLQPRPPVAD